MRALHAVNHASQDLTGHILGQQFRLERLLGRGGMGDVYLAEQLEVGRHVVIKLLRTAQLSDAQAEERFKREARVLAQLNHPNIVHLYTAGRSDDGQAYLAMEYIAGRTLASLVAEAGALPEEQVISILDQVCSALMEAHGLGIVHRDLKPENVMVVERRDQPPLVKVLDFGIAKLSGSSADAKLTLDGEILGTPLYMAPEQLREQRADERSDIYALASIGYELLTGSVPFEAETTLSLIVRVMTEEVVPPRRRMPGLRVSAATDGLITRCLAKDPRERIQSAHELRDVLTDIARELIAIQPSLADSGALRLPEPAADGGGRTRVPSRSWSWLLVLLALAGLGTWAYLAQRAQDVPIAADPTQPGGLPVHEWIQGMPFPPGCDFASFEPKYIEVRIPASVVRVLAFYRFHLAAKWGGARELPDGLAFDDSRAPVVKLTVREAGSGSRVAVVRRVLQP